MRRLLPLLLVLAFAAPARADEPTLAFTSFTLDNGLQVFVIEDHTTPTVAVVTYYNVGAKDELPGKTGFAHLFEHLMFEGSAHVPDGGFDLHIEAAGGNVNAFTTSDETVYEDVASSSFLEPALWFEADRLAGLLETFDQAKLDRQRDVVKNERRQRVDNQPYGRWYELIGEALWPRGQAYHWPTIGYMKDLTAATLDDVKAFFRRYYVPRNAILVIAGDVDPAKTRALVTRYLGWIPGGAVPERPAYRKLAPITKEIRLVTKDDVQAPRLYVAWRGPADYSPDEPAMTLAANLLGDGLSSRLQKRLLHDEQLAQDVAAFHQPQALAGKVMVIATPKPGVATEKLLGIIDEEIARLARTPPEASELTRVQNAHEAAFLGGLEDLLARAERLATYAAHGKPDYLGEDLERFRRVTGVDVSTVVARYLRPEARVVMTILPEKQP